MLVPCSLQWLKAIFITLSFTQNKIYLSFIEQTFHLVVGCMRKCRFISLIVISQKCMRSHAMRWVKHELNLISHKFQLDSSQVDFSLSTHVHHTHTHTLHTAVCSRSLILKYTSDYRMRRYHEKCAINFTTMRCLDGANNAFNNLQIKCELTPIDSGSIKGEESSHY